MPEESRKPFCRQCKADLPENHGSYFCDEECKKQYWADMEVGNKRVGESGIEYIKRKCSEWQKIRHAEKTVENDKLLSSFDGTVESLKGGELK